MASVTPRRNPSGAIIWRVNYRVDGKQRQDTFDSERSAREYGRLVDRVGGDAARAVLMARDRDIAEIPTLRQWCATYLDPSNGWLTGITEGTRDGYAKLAERSFLAILGDIPLDALTKQDVARWVHWQEQQPPASGRAEKMSAKTVKNYHAVLSAMLAAAVEAQQIQANVARSVRITPGMQSEMVFLTEQELQAIVDAMPAHYRALTLFLAGTGMRWGEATAITWGDFDLAATPPTARVTKAWKRGPNGTPVLGPPKTRKSTRTISLWPELIDALGEPQAPEMLVFRGIQDGKRMWSTRYRLSAWEPALKRANLGKHPRIHDLRHTHASWLIAAGVPLPYVQARLGHEKITTTVDTYGHLMPEAHVQMADATSLRMGGVLRPVFVPPATLAVTA